MQQPKHGYWGVSWPWWLCDALRWRLEFGGTIDAVFKELVAIIASGQDRKIIATGQLQFHVCREDSEVPYYNSMVDPPTLEPTRFNLTTIPASEWITALPIIDGQGQPTSNLKCSVCRRPAWHGVVFADESALTRAWLSIEHREKQKPGPKRNLRRSIIEKMLFDLSSGRRTVEELQADTLYALHIAYGGSPNTANAARADAIADFQQSAKRNSEKF